MEDVRVVETSDEHIEGYHHCVGVVARERQYLAMLDAPPIDKLRAFVESIRNADGVHVVAVDSVEDVIGWCDIVRLPLDGFRHVGRLGMGLLPKARGIGVGRRLVEETVKLARERGVERVQLDVFATNRRAIRLYESLGFVHEGVQRRARQLDGVYDDLVLMALIFDA
jgi:ribosomal protein S18 acetylase RimI-like enzyme